MIDYLNIGSHIVNTTLSAVLSGDVHLKLETAYTYCVYYVSVQHKLNIVIIPVTKLISLLDLFSFFFLCSFFIPIFELKSMCRLNASIEKHSKVSSERTLSTCLYTYVIVNKRSK